MLAKTIIALSLITGTVALTNHSRSRHLATKNTTSPSSPQTVTQRTNTDTKKFPQNITVQIYAGKDRASGILVTNENNTYSVITNDRVIDKKETYTIRTPDEMEHTATLVSLVGIVTDNNLATLEFNSNNNYQVVIADLNEAISINPEFAEAHKIRGDSYLKLEQYDKARADHTQMIALEPENASAYISRARLYEELEQYDKAIADYTQAITLEPENASAYYNRAWSYSRLEQYDKAIADYTQIITLRPENAFAYYYRAQLFMKN
ncbi:MAG: tetratricopeptide repeat protein [Cyanobacteria bacterium J06621_12]